MRRPETLALALALALAVAASTGCSTSSGSYVWVHDYAAPPAPELKDVIGPGDVISVHVWNAEQMTSRQRVRTDGTISLFFADSIRVADLTTTEASKEIASHLTDVLQSPRVNIVIEESAAASVSILGEVAHPGSYSVLTASSILRALAAAGGLTEYAHRDRIFVLRPAPAPARIRVSLDALGSGDSAAVSFALRSGDVVMVE